MRLLKLVPDNTNIGFLKWRMPFYVVSLLLIAASWGLVWFNGLNLGVDFAGGHEVRVTFEDRAGAPIAELRERQALELAARRGPDRCHGGGGLVLAGPAFLPNHGERARHPAG